MIRASLLATLLLGGDGVTLKYATERTPKDKISVEQKLTLEGTDQMLAFVRSMHPFLSLEKLVVRADGTRQVLGGKKQRFEYDEARVEMRYDDEDYEYDYTKGMPPESDKDKIKQMMWFFAAGGRTFTLTAEGEYRSEDKDQDHNGEAMDHIALGIVRLPDKPVEEGDAWEKSWTGQRSEKGKKGKFAFTQKVKVEKIEERGGKKVATLAGDLAGKLQGEKDPSAEEAWTKCEGKTKTVIEVESGRVLSSEGQGKVTAYYRGVAENGGKNELTLTFGVEGKTRNK